MNSIHPGVVHLVDSLAMGGTERVAVNIVNHLPRDRYTPFICTTRHDGPLAGEVAADVERLSLDRRCTLDLAGILRLVDFVRHHNIRLIHAHSSTLFVAGIVSLFPPFPQVIWHDHYGRYAEIERPRLQYWALTRRASGVITVNQALAEWSRQVLHVQSDRVWYVPNFACLSSGAAIAADLPGIPGYRIVCVANFRPQKDHLTLLRAMSQVVQRVPEAHLILVGAAIEALDSDLVLSTIANLGLSQQVTWLGQHHDVAGILRASDIGVLSSASEGLPLALLEYGMAGLPVVTTRVGQCAEVLEDGQAGLLISPGSAEDMAAALVQLLRSPVQRVAFGERLRYRVGTIYSVEAVIAQICNIYDQVLNVRFSTAICR